MNFAVFVRIALSITVGILGALFMDRVAPIAVFAEGGRFIILVAFLASATLGFILPDVLELAGKAGIIALSHQIARYLPTRGVGVSRLPFRTSGRKEEKYINPLLIDTSVLIDGKILNISKTGFVYGTFLVIPSVVKELHALADSASELKRAKGRRGLDILSELSEVGQIKVQVLDTEPKEGGVDEKLVSLAKKIKAKIVTVDFNLNKVAKVHKVVILNINELASAARTVVLPNEQLHIQIVSEGKEKQQGIGYLEDGTMVVVEDGAWMIGRTIDVVVLRVLQTVAGKMVFARINKPLETGN